MSVAPFENATVAIYDSPAELAAALERFRRAGFALDRVSVASIDGGYGGRAVTGCYGGSGRVQYWGDLAGFWGELWGMLSGWAFFQFPDIGPVLVAGPLSGWIVAALKDSSVFGGLDALGAALHNVGIPRNRITEYEMALKDSKFLLLVHGASREVNRARELLESVCSRRDANQARGSA